MKGVSCWDDLRPFGIIPLTGESCALSYRILFDVTAEGKKVIEKCLGCEVKLAENWNSGSSDHPHVGSIMLSHELLIPLGIFALLESGCSEVWMVWNALVGIEPADNPHVVEITRKRHGEQLRRILSYGRHGDRNVHQFSGRVS